jgi:hypothetical protein
MCATCNKIVASTTTLFFFTNLLNFHAQKPLTIFFFYSRKRSEKKETSRKVAATDELKSKNLGREGKQLAQLPTHHATIKKICIKCY